MPLRFDTFEPSEAMRPVYDGLLISFQPWGAMRPSPVFSDLRVKLGPPAEFGALLEAQQFMESAPPRDLDRFWQIANGLVFDVDTIVFSTEQFIEENKRVRTLKSYMPFTGLFFISSLGDGDMFALGRTVDGEWLNSVMIWEHETDRRYEVAESFQEYVAKLLVWWLDPNPKKD
jgi:SMI1/KNR4 family protein SUKH-1